MASQAEKGRLFRALHERDHAFIIPNPWDIGTARLLQLLGFEALAEVAHSVGFPFILRARAENYVIGRPDLRDTIARLQAFQEAGADVLFAPGLKSKDDIITLVRSVDRPVNVVMGLQGVQLNLAELSEIGVRRVSVGSGLSRAALGAFLRAAREMQADGTFNFAEDAVKYADINGMLA